MRIVTSLLIASMASSALLAAQQTSHPSSLDDRGAHVMGFDQQKTTHHFYLYGRGSAEPE